MLCCMHGDIYFVHFLIYVVTIPPFNIAGKDAIMELVGLMKQKAEMKLLVCANVIQQKPCGPKQESYNLLKT